MDSRKPLLNVHDLRVLSWSFIRNATYCSERSHIGLKLLQYW